MKNSKWVSILSASALTLSLFAPADAAAPTEAVPSMNDWNSERYGDRIDIDQSLNELTQDENFKKEADKKIKAQADEVAGGESDSKADKEGEQLLGIIRRLWPGSKNG